MASWPCLLLRCFPVILSKPIKLRQASSVAAGREWPEGQITSSPAKSPQLLPSREVPSQGLVQHRGYSNSITSCLASATASPSRVPQSGLHTGTAPSPKSVKQQQRWPRSRPKTRRSEHKGRGGGIKAHGKGHLCDVQPGQRFPASWELAVRGAASNLLLKAVAFRSNARCPSPPSASFPSAFSSSSSAASGLNKFNFIPNGHLRNLCNDVQADL